MFNGFRNVRAALALLFAAGMLVAPAAVARAQESYDASAPAATTPAPPQTPEQMPPQPPRVSFQNGKLTISAENSRLSDVLDAIKEKTGADIDAPANLDDDRVVVHLGPGPARDVLNALFYGMPFNYVIAGSETNAADVSNIVLTKKTVILTNTMAARSTGSYSPAAARAAEAQQAMMEHLREQEEAAAASANAAVDQQNNATEQGAAPLAQNPQPAQPAVPASGPNAAVQPADASAAATSDPGAATGATSSSASGGAAATQPQHPVDQMSNMMFRMYQERQQMIQQQKNPPKPPTEP